MAEKRSSHVGTVLLITPLVIAPLVLLGVYFGYYVGAVTGYDKSILAIVFSTIGFLVAVFIVNKVIVYLVARSSKARG